MSQLLLSAETGLCQKYHQAAFAVVKVITTVLAEELIMHWFKVSH